MQFLRFETIYCGVTIAVFGNGKETRHAVDSLKQLDKHPGVLKRMKRRISNLQRACWYSSD